MDEYEEFTTDDIHKIFEAVQETTACHLKYALVLKKSLEFDKNDGSILEELIRCIHISLLTNYKVKNIYLDRVINFVTTMCNGFKTKDENGDHPVFLHILRHLIESIHSSDESCRYWSCVLIKNILENWEDLPENIYFDVREAMLERLKDPKAPIRLEAIAVLCHFQEPTDREDPVINYLSNMIQCDMNAGVRQRCVEKIALTKHVLPLILDRCRDVDVNVKLAAFKRITSIGAHLKVTQKRLALQCGFLDSSEKIRNFVSTTLLENWLQIFENDFFGLMKSVRLDACEEDIKKTTFLAEQILNSLFKSRPISDIIGKIKLNEHKLIEYDDLNWESTLYYRIVIQYLRQSEQLLEEFLHKILPELVVFCKYIIGYCNYVKCKEDYFLLEYYFTLEQFFIITRGYDVSDNASRQSLNSLTHFMLQKTQLNAAVAEVIIRNIEKTIPNVKDRSLYICEIISNIMYGEDAIDYEEAYKQEIERKQQISQIKSDLMSLFEEKQVCVSEKRFLEAAELENQVKEKETALKNLETFQEKVDDLSKEKTDVATITKYLTVAQAFLKSPSIKVLNSALATLCTEKIQPLLIHEDWRVKTEAFKCYALCCIIDIKSARYGIHIFSAPILSGHVIDEDDIGILIVSIKAAVDLLSIYGLSLVEKTDEEQLSDSQKEDERKVFVGGTSLADLIEGLANLLDHLDPEVEETATLGICDLLLNNRLTSSSLVSRLIIKWANPATDSEKVKQFIGYTLNMLPSLPTFRTYFSDTVLTTIKTLVYAPYSSPLSEVNVDNIAKFMATMCLICPEGTDIHGDIALKICSQMIEKPRLKVNLVYSKVLLFLNLQQNKCVTELQNMCDQIKDVVRNSAISKNIIKFNTKLTDTNAKLPPVWEE